MKFTIIDTSVLCEFLEVPGMCSNPKDVQLELRIRAESGERFVVPIASVIETGNHIAQIKSGDRWAATQRFVALLEEAAAEGGPFVLHRVSWDEEFLAELRSGDGTGETLLELSGNGKLGSGDVAILVERDRLLGSSAYAQAYLWTLDEKLDRYNR
jgi:hypothetical protein